MMKNNTAFYAHQIMISNYEYHAPMLSLLGIKRMPAVFFTAALRERLLKKELRRIELKKL